MSFGYFSLYILKVLVNGMSMIFLLFLFFFSPLAAEEEEPEFSLTNLTKNPVEKVAGSVNVITGNWVHQQYHDEPSGPDAIPVAHTYVSSSLEEGSLADGWDFFSFPQTLRYFSQKESLLYPKGPQVTTLCCTTEKQGEQQFFLKVMRRLVISIRKLKRPVTCMSTQLKAPQGEIFIELVFIGTLTRMSGWSH